MRQRSGADDGQREEEEEQGRRQARGGAACSRTGGGRQQGEARRQGKKGCWLCSSSSHLSVSINTRRLVCLWFGGRRRTWRTRSTLSLSLSDSRSVTRGRYSSGVPFPCPAACLRLLRMEAKETVPCAEQGVTPRGHQWPVENGKRCRNSALLEFNGQGPRGKVREGKGRGGDVIS